MSFGEDYGCWTIEEHERWKRKYGKNVWEMTDDEREDALAKEDAEIAEQTKQRRRAFVEKFKPLVLSDDKLNASTKPNYLVDGAFVAGSPAVIGGVEKTLKSSIAMELAICLAAAESSKFLNHFNTTHDKPSGVVYANFDINTEKEIFDRVRRIENERGVKADRRHLCVLNCTLPPLNTKEGLEGLDQALEHIEGGVLIVDTLFDSLPGVDFTQKSVVGHHLSRIYNICRGWDVTPLYIHHFNKDDRSDGLQALSGAGLKEHVGQWMLLRRVGRYDPETGHQRLRLEIGARLGYGGRYTLEVTEGNQNDSGGRRWETTVTPYSAKPAAEQDAVASNKRDAGTSKLAEDVLAYIAANPDSTLRAVRSGLGNKRSHRSISQAVESLVTDEKVVKAEVVVRGNRTSGYRTQDVGSTRDLSHVESHEENGGEKKP